MNAPSVVALVVTIALAALGYVATYLNGLRLAVRSDALDRVNSQLRDLYGPLTALLSAGDLVFYRAREVEGWEPDWRNADEHRKAAWHLWMSHVFMPLNRRMLDIITTHAHLIDEDYMPPELLLLCSHIVGYEALMTQWDEGNYDRMAPLILFPSAVSDYVRESFQRLKIKQTRLIGGTRSAINAVRPVTLDQLKQAHPQYFHDEYRARDVEGAARDAGTST